jgi:hypothetical protein
VRNTVSVDCLAPPTQAQIDFGRLIDEPPEQFANTIDTVMGEVLFAATED